MVEEDGEDGESLLMFLLNVKPCGLSSTKVLHPQLLFYGTHIHLLKFWKVFPQGHSLTLKKVPQSFSCDTVDV